MLAICIAFVTIQCSVEQESTNDSQTQNITYSQNVNLETELPVAALDNSNFGLYVGTIVTNDLSFHEKIYIKLKDDGSSNAQIVTAKGKIIPFSGTRLNSKANQYAFSGNQGSFIAIISDQKLTVIEAFINANSAVINVSKSTSTQRRMPSLGTFTSNDGSLTGTWDFTFQGVSGGDGYTTPTLTIVRTGGSTAVLDITGTYQRLCSPPGSPVPIGIVNSSFFNIQSNISGTPITLAGADFSYNFVANRLEGENVGCLNQPSSPLDVVANVWDWNGIQGTVTLNSSSLPNF